MAYQFGTSGAVPTNTATPYNANIVPGSTPQSKALSMAGLAAPSSASSLLPSSKTQTTTPQVAAPTAYSPAIAPVTSGLLPKKQTVTNADGSSHTVEYQAPTTPTTPSTSNQSTPTSGGASAFSVTPKQEAAGGTPAQIAANTGQNAQAPATTPGLMQPQTASVGTNPTPASVGGLLGDTSLNPLPTISSLESEAANIAKTLPGAEAAVLGSPGIAADQEGRESNLATAGGAELSGIGSVLGQENTTQSNIQSGLTDAGSLLTPSNNLLTVPFNQQLVGADGQPIGGSSGSGALQSAVVNAIDLIKSGSGYSNAVAAANLSQFGPQGTTALLNALGPKFNVNMADADAAAVAQNINTTATASTAAANTAYSNAVQAVSKATGAYTAATGVASNLTSTLGSWTQNGKLTSLNQGLNSVASLTSDPQYSQFVAALTNAQAAYTAAFQSSGITPTQSTENALKELNPNSSATAIVASLNQLSSDLHAATIVPTYQQQSTYASQLGIK